jgi:hypothetical protein
VIIIIIVNNSQMRNETDRETGEKSHKSQVKLKKIYIRLQTCMKAKEKNEVCSNCIILSNRSTLTITQNNSTFI